MDHITRVAGEAEDLRHVALVGGVGAMAGGLDDGDLEIGEGAAAGDLGEADAGLIFNCSDHFSDVAWGHAVFFLYVLIMRLIGFDLFCGVQE